MFGFCNAIDRRFQLRKYANIPLEHPSIGDRAGGLVPHVNVGDAYFGLWNAIHIIARQINACSVLAKNGNFAAIKPIPPGKDIFLEARVIELHERARIITARFEGVYSIGGQILLKLHGAGTAKRNSKDAARI